MGLTSISLSETDGSPTHSEGRQLNQSHRQWACTERGNVNVVGSG